MADIETLQLDTENNVINLSSKDDNVNSILINNPLSLLQDNIELSSQNQIKQVSNTLNERIWDTIVLITLYNIQFSAKRFKADIS